MGHRINQRGHEMINWVGKNRKHSAAHDYFVLISNLFLFVKYTGFLLVLDILKSLNLKGKKSFENRHKSIIERAQIYLSSV